MRPDVIARATAAVALTLVVPGTAPAGAQDTLAVREAPPPPPDSIRLRYRPVPGAMVHTLQTTDVTMTVMDESGAAGSGGAADSITLETTMRQSITERVREASAAQFLVARTLDSARLRMRAEGGAWADRPVDALVGVTAEVVLNERLQIEGFRLAGDERAPALVTDALRTPSTGYELAFPEGFVVTGKPWTAEVVYPFNNPIELEGAAAALVEHAELIARASVMLDSLVVRPTDSLAYLRVTGSFLPLTIPAAPEEGRGPTDVTGAFAGRLIWSTGWNAFVSGASRAVVVMRMASPTAAAGSTAGTTLRFNAQSRFRVRP